MQFSNNMKPNNTAPTNENQFVLYQLPEEEGVIQVVIKDESIWATQKAMASLFGVGVPAISKHLKNIFEEGELDEKVVVSKMEITSQHGAIEGLVQTNITSFYSLDAIISVGYRVNSAKATKFRIWATGVLKEYIRKGFVLNDNRLKNLGGGGYWKELLERIREFFTLSPINTNKYFKTILIHQDTSNSSRKK